MSRVIKFRQPMFGEDGEFIGFHYWGFIDGKFIGPSNTWVNGRESEQYSGLLDKNRREIYEGDIINTGIRNYQVTYNPPSFDLDGYDDGDYYSGGYAQTWHWDSFEIVGNIYENPELLKAGDK